MKITLAPFLGVRLLIRVTGDIHMSHKVGINSLDGDLMQVYYFDLATSEFLGSAQ